MVLIIFNIFQPNEALDVKEEGKDVVGSPANKKKRVLPDWMVEMAGSSAAKASKAPKANSKTPSKPAGILPPSVKQKTSFDIYNICIYFLFLVIIKQDKNIAMLSW